MTDRDYALTVSAHAMIGELVHATGNLPSEADIDAIVDLASIAADKLEAKMRPIVAECLPKDAN